MMTTSPRNSQTRVKGLRIRARIARSRRTTPKPPDSQKSKIRFHVRSRISTFLHGAGIMATITTKRQALAEARRRFGKTATVRDRGWIFTKHYGAMAGEPRPTTIEERQAIIARRDAANAAFEAHSKTRPNCRSWPQDDTVANFRAAMDAFDARYAELRAAEKDLRSACFSLDRFEVVTHNGFCGYIRGSGMTWDGMFDNAK